MSESKLYHTSYCSSVTPKHKHSRKLSLELPFAPLMEKGFHLVSQTLKKKKKKKIKKNQQNKNKARTNKQNKNNKPRTFQMNRKTYDSNSKARNNKSILNFSMLNCCEKAGFCGRKEAKTPYHFKKVNPGAPSCFCAHHHFSLLAPAP